MVTGPPDFIGIGAQRSGTSWWFRLLNRHPLIHSAHGHKELHYLSRFAAGEPTEEDSAAYARWFPRPPGAIAGEWTPYYMLHFWMGPLLARMAPAARLLVILRDPVERYASGIALDRAEGGGVSHATQASHFYRGLYNDHLSRLEPHLSEGSLLVLQYERCVLEPQRQLERTFRFLEVDPIDVSMGDVQRPDAPRQEPSWLSPERRSLLVEAYRPGVERLAARHAEIDPSLWRNFL